VEGYSKPLLFKLSSGKREKIRYSEEQQRVKQVALTLVTNHEASIPLKNNFGKVYRRKTTTSLSSKARENRCQISQ